MKYTFLINQKAIIENNIDIDIVDACIIDVMISFSHSDKILKTFHKGLSFYWFSHKHISQQLPLLNLKRDTIYRRLKALCDKCLLVRLEEDKEKPFYAFTPKILKLYFNENNEGTQKPTGVGYSSVGGSDIHPIDTIINNTHVKSEKNTCVSSDQDLNKYFEELHTGKYKPDNVDRNHNAFTFENKELNDQLNINWEALVNQFNEITKKKAKAVLPRAKRQIMHLITNGYTKSDLVKVFTLASRDDWFKNNSNALNIDYLTREEVFTKYADI